MNRSRHRCRLRYHAERIRPGRDSLRRAAQRCELHASASGQLQLAG